jgi:predicted ArsR family transcriptional regulator
MMVESVIPEPLQSMPHTRTLVYLAFRKNGGKMTALELREATGLGSATVYNSLAEMEEKGYVEEVATLSTDTGRTPAKYVLTGVIQDDGQSEPTG